MTLAGKTVLVTGATGFIAGVVVRRLAAEGAQVRALGRSPEKSGRIQDTHIEFVQGNIRDAERMKEVVRGCTHVFHAAASYGRLASQRATNMEGTRNVIRAAAEAGVARVVHVSSMAVYGYGYDGDVTEDMPHKPGKVVYNLTKSEGEGAVREVAGQTGLSAAIMRPGMVYGPGSNMWTANLFKLGRRNPTIFVGSGKGLAFPIHVNDVADMAVVLLTHPAASGEAFHCTPDPGPTWREFLGGYSRLAGHSNWLGIPVAPLKLVVPLAEAYLTLRGTPQDLPMGLRYLESRVTFKMTKARDLLGWQPRIGLQEGIESCVPWLRERGLLKEKMD